MTAIDGGLSEIRDVAGSLLESMDTSVSYLLARTSGRG